MQLIKALAVFLATVVLSHAAAISSCDDWKYGVGWNGVVLDPTAIGTPTFNTTTRSLEVLICSWFYRLRIIHIVLPTQKRTVGGVYICTDVQWHGKCGYAVQPLNECIYLTSPWYKTISSFGPDPGTECLGESTDYRYLDMSLRILNSSV